MTKNPFAPSFDDLPEEIAIFPLDGVLLLPGGQLPLNIFEPRYLAMINDALSGSRMIGMVQPREADVSSPPVFGTGCAGKITEFSETDDGRYLITLTGVCRFDIADEHDLHNGYRRVSSNWAAYKEDITSPSCLDLDRSKLNEMLEQYFEQQGMNCDWKAVKDASDGRLITCLSMICPFETSEKQALLEAKCCRTRANIFMTMLEMAVASAGEQTSKH